MIIQCFRKYMKVKNLDSCTKNLPIADVLWYASNAELPEG